MALIGHWVAADAGGAGTNLPDRSASAADGTLTGGCTWVTIGGEAAVNCPDGDTVNVPDNAMWTLTNFTFIARVSFNSASGNAGVLSHEPGGGFQPKWAWYQGGANGQHIYENDAANSNETMDGTSWSRSADTIYALGVKRSGNNYSFYKDGATNGTAVGVSTLPFDVASALHLFYGGEGAFGGNIKGISLRVYDTALADADIFTAMLEDGPVAVALADTAALAASDAVSVQAIDPVGPLADTASLALTESLTIGETESIGPLADSAAIGLAESVTVLLNPLFLSLTDSAGLGLSEGITVLARLPLADALPLRLTESLSIETNPASLRLTWNELIRGDGEATLHLDWFEVVSPASEPAALRLTWDERQGFGGSLRLTWREVPDLPTPSRTAPQKPTATVTVS